jgi:hypothetical protein
MRSIATKQSDPQGHSERSEESPPFIANDLRGDCHDSFAVSQRLRRIATPQERLAMPME